MMRKVGGLIDCRGRQYMEREERIRKEDVLVLTELIFFYTLGETYVRFVLPVLSPLVGLGPLSGTPMPYAEYFTRFVAFVGGPLGYLWMYIVVCGSIHMTYTYIWPEEGARLSIQGKTMSDADQKKAILFSCKSIAATCGASSFMYYAAHGRTNMRGGGMPELREVPWFVLAYFLCDIAAYTVHRSLHHPWWYARVHKVHHIWKNPNVFVVSALHPTEILSMTTFTLAVCVTLPLSLPTVVVLLLWMFVGNAIDHSGMHLENWTLCRLLFWQAHPEFHDNHHKYFHANYGAMVDWWDRMFGTYYNPKAHGDLGLGEHEFTPASGLRRRSEMLHERAGNGAAGAADAPSAHSLVAGAGAASER